MQWLCCLPASKVFYIARMNLAIAVGAVLFAAQLAPVPQDEIVFVCNRGGAENICTINSTSLEIRQVSFERETDAFNRGPRWSIRPEEDRVLSSLARRCRCPHNEL